MGAMKAIHVRRCVPLPRWPMPTTSSAATQMVTAALAKPVNAPKAPKPRAAPPTMPSVRSVEKPMSNLAWVAKRCRPFRSPISAAYSA